MQSIVQSILQLVSGPEGAWDKIQIPMPEGVMIYASDTKTIKLADGVSLYADLDTVYDLDDWDDAYTFGHEFPFLSVDVANGVVSVTADKRYSYTQKALDALMITTVAQTQVDTRSDAEHDHNDAYYTIGQTSTFISKMGSAKDNQLISYLLLRELSLTDGYYSDANGVADSFTTLDNVTVTTGNWSDGTITSADGILDIISLVKELEANIATSYIYISTDSDESVVNCEVSRDGGTNWETVTLVQNALSTDSIKILTGSALYTGLAEGSSFMWRIHADTPIELYGVRMYSV